MQLSGIALSLDAEGLPASLLSVLHLAFCCCVFITIMHCNFIVVQ